MIFNRKGRIVDNLYILGHPAIPVYLLDGPSPVLFDTGFACMGTRYVEESTAILDGRPPSYCFLTHAHFDHCGAMAAFKQAFPGLKTAASAEAVQVLQRPSAVERIRRLNRAAARMVHQYGIAGGDAAEDFETFDIDCVIADGNRIQVSSTDTVEVIATPGHTRDCLSFYLPAKKLLFSSEAAGQPDQTGYVVTDCLQDYDRYLDSLQRLAGLDIEILCPGHIFVYTGPSARIYIQQALDACRRFRTRVERIADEEDGDIERIILRIRGEEYDVKPPPKQPEPAYLLNLEARIKAVLRAKAA